MRRRVPVLVTLAAVLVATVGLGPAYAVLDTPVVSDLDATTPGQVTGTVTSAAPYVTVRLAADVPPEVVPLTEGSGSFDLDTWGYAGTLPVLVASCEDAEQVECSAETASAATFVPTDLVPEVTWPADQTVGAADTPSVTVADPGGGGDLLAIWDSAGEDLQTAVTRDVAVPLNLSDGSGVVRLVRCRAGSTTVCAAFDPDQSIALEVDTVISATLSDVPDLSESSPSAPATVDTDSTGTYALTWAFEQDGSPVDGIGGAATGTLDGNGATDPFDVDGTGLLDGTYDLVVTITVTNDQFGAYGAFTATDPVTATGLGPVVTATVASVLPITQNRLSTAVTVDTDQTGSYALTWELKQGENVVASGSPSGDLDPDGAASFTVDGTGVVDGTYDVVTTITVTKPGLGTFPAIGATGALVVDRTGPPVTLTRSVGTIYPLIGTVAYPALTRVDVVGDPSPVTGFVVRTAGSGVTVRNLALNVNKTVWNGRNNAGKIVASGTYAIFAVDAAGNRNAAPVNVTVSRKTLVLKSFIKDVTASGSMYDKFVGRCSTLRIPSARGTKGSLGFYANTKCGTQTFSSSAVSTAHAIKVPAAAKYLDMHVNVTGGAAVGHAGSQGVLRYLSTAGTWRNETVMTSSYGIHRGPTTSLTGLLDANNFLVWGFLTAYGDRYDVIRFTVVVRYYVLA